MFWSYEFFLTLGRYLSLMIVKLAVWIHVEAKFVSNDDQITVVDPLEMDQKSTFLFRWEHLCIEVVKSWDVDKETLLLLHTREKKLPSLPHF